MPHAYVTVSVLKGTGRLNIDGTAFDTALRQVAESVSEAVDRLTDRTFQPFDGTRFYSGDGGTLLLVDDVVSVTSLVEDDQMDGTFDVTWVAADFLTVPFNADPTSEWGRPITRLQVSPKSNGTQDVFLRGARNYRVIGTFGYVDVTRDSGVQTSGTTGTGTTVTVNTSGVEPGMMLLIGSGTARERVYVDSTAAGGTSLTVRRAQYGSTSSNHATTLTVNYHVYPQAIVEAAFMQAARLWQRRNSGFATTVGLPETGMFTTFRGLDDDVKLMLNPYRRLH